MEITSRSFAIRDWLDFDAKGRAACPSCQQDGKKRQKNLFVNTDGKYWCYRGCTTEQIRAVLGAPPPGQGGGGAGGQGSRGAGGQGSRGARDKGTRVQGGQGGQGGSTAQISALSPLSPPSPLSPLSTPASQPRTVPEKQVQQAVKRLLHPDGVAQQQALAWLEARGFTYEMIQHYRLGLDPRWITPNENNPNERECYWSVTIHIPADEPGQFYKKMRVAPWLVGDARPEYVSKWCQYGVPTTIWFTYLPEDAEATWYCEGEWDAMRLGWLARQHGAKIAVCCSTGGCGTVPKDQLDRLPGIVTIFFDRNDEPRKDGTIPGDEGAKKLALALDCRGRIARVPMPDECDVKGWDVSNALDAGYTWEDFLSAAASSVELRATEVEAIARCDRKVPTLRDSILEILNRYDTPSLRDVALMELALKSGYSYRDVEKLAKSLAIEVDLQTDQVEAAKKLQNLIKTQRTQLDLNRYLEPWFAQVLTQTALAMPTAPEFLFTTLLSAAASRVGTAARVVIKPSAKYTQSLVFWTAIVANSGSMKTPAQRVILDPLVALETEAYESYLLKLADYRAEESSKGKNSNSEERSKPPTRQRYLTKDVTLETLQRIHGENPRGLLYYRDELAANSKVRNQYRGGHGADEEAELDQWTGSAILYDRAEKAVCLPRSAISRTGGYQWEVLAKLMGDHNDFNGNFARWLFCAAKTPLRYLQLLREEQDTGISEALTYLYVELEKVPEQDYLLSYEAKQLLETWQHQLVDAQQSEDAFGLQLAFPKIEAYTARLALWLHIVNAVLRGEKPAQVINGDTMEKAIELAAYYLWQYRLIHTHNSPDSGLAALGLKVQKFAERIGQATASALKSGIRTLRKMATDQIRQLMQTLADAGYGRVMGEGAEMVYVPIPSDTSLQVTNGENDAGNCQFVNSAPEYTAMTGVASVDAECQSERQLSTAQKTHTSEDDPPSRLRTSGIDLTPVLISEGSINRIDRIDTQLTAVSIPETKNSQASRVSVDTIDREEVRSQESGVSDNFVRLADESTVQAPSSIDEIKTEISADSNGERGGKIFIPSGGAIATTDLSDTSTLAWNGFKVGDLVVLGYRSDGGNASVIDPAQYPEMGAQPQPDYVPVRCATTEKSEWYPAAWVRFL